MHNTVAGPSEQGEKSHPLRWQNRVLIRWILQAITRTVKKMFGTRRHHVMVSFFNNILINEGCESIILVLTCRPYNAMQEALLCFGV